MAQAATNHELSLRETSHMNAQGFRQTLMQFLHFSDLAGSLRLSDIHAGTIAVCNIAACPQDSWQIKLLMGGKPNPSIGELEHLGLHSRGEGILNIRCGFRGGYNIIQMPVGLPGAENDMAEHEFERDVDALAFVMRVIAGIDFAEGTSKLIQPDEPRKFQKHWYDFLSLRLTIYAERRFGWNRDDLVVVTYGDQKILVPLTKEARQFMHEQLPADTERMFGGYVLTPELWKDEVSKVRDLCHGGVLYLDSVTG